MDARICSSMSDLLFDIIEKKGFSETTWEDLISEKTKQNELFRIILYGSDESSEPAITSLMDEDIRVETAEQTSEATFQVILQAKRLVREALEGFHIACHLLFEEMLCQNDDADQTDILNLFEDKLKGNWFGLPQDKNLFTIWQELEFQKLALLTLAKKTDLLQIN
jgi:hypothetical protein